MQAQQSEPQQTDPQEESEENVSLFAALRNVIRDSTGIALTIAYIVLLLTSMTYLYIYYIAFDIDIIRYVTFDDIIAAPIKNPNIVFTYIVLILVFYTADFGGRHRLKTLKKYEGKPIPAKDKFLFYIFWAPKKTKTNLVYTIITILFILCTYIYLFSSKEAEVVKEGRGNIVEIILADNTKTTTNLLGTSLNYIFTYDTETQKSMVYYIEAVASISPQMDVKKTIEIEATISDENPKVIRD